MGSMASAWGLGCTPPSGLPAGGHLNLARPPPAQLPPSFSKAEWQCNGNRRRAGANNWDISGQPGPIVVSSCLCRPLALLFFVFLPPGWPVSHPQCVFLTCCGLSGWPGNVQLILGFTIHPEEPRRPILETQLLRSRLLVHLELNLVG